MADPIAQLFIELRAGTAAFAGDLNKAQQLSFNSAREMERSFKRIGIALTTALTTAATATGVLVAQSINVADKMGKMSQAAGVSVEKFSALAFAARLSDVDTQTLASSFTALARTLDRANNATSQTQVAYRSLTTLFGGSIPVFKGTEDAFLQIADRISKMPDSFQKSAIAANLFRGSSAQLIPFLNQGREGIEKLLEKMKEFGLIVTQETADRADKFNDTIDEMKLAFQGVGIQLASALLPFLQDLVSIIKDSATNADVLHRNVTILTTAFKIAATAVLGLWSALVDLGNILALLASPLAAIEGLGKKLALAFVSPFVGLPLLIADIIKSFDRVKASFQSSLEEFKKGSGAAELIEKLWNNVGTAAENAIKKLKVPPLPPEFTEAGKKLIESLQLQVDSFGLSVKQATILKAIRDGALKTEAEIAGELARQLDVMEKATRAMPKPTPLADLDNFGLRVPSFPPEIPQELPEVDFTKIDEFSRDIPQFPIALKEANVELDKMKPLVETLSDGFEDLFTTAIFHADGLLDALNKVTQAIAVMALKQFAIGPLFSAIGGLISPNIDPLGIGSLPLTRGGGVFGRASGGPVFAGMPYIVGERGPEQFIPNVNGTIIPNSGMRSTQAAVMNFNFNGVSDADSFNRSRGQIGAFMQRQLAIASGRNG